MLLIFKASPTWHEDQHPRETSGRFATKRSTMPAMDFNHPDRTPWGDFPDVLIHAEELRVKKHPLYDIAKAGNGTAAWTLAAELMSPAINDALTRLTKGRLVFVLPVHANETVGINEIPIMMAENLADMLQLPVWLKVIQVNTVGHTGASGFHRMANQPLFDGPIIPGADYLIVDDFIGMGGTVANLRGYVERQGGRVLAATALTGKPYSAILKPRDETLRDLRSKHGPELEHWWQGAFGHDFSLLTQSEARYLHKSRDVDTIRDRLLAARFG